MGRRSGVRLGLAIALALFVPATGGASQATRTPLRRTVDLNVGDSREVELSDGKKVAVKLLDLREEKDALRGAVRLARVRVAVGGVEAELEATNYNLPVTVAGVRIDCPITKGWYEKTNADRWGLGGKDARLRLWPAGSPLLEPGTFVYPVRQRWFASDTQMCNEPVFVDGPELAIGSSGGKIYYHSGLDIDGMEGKVEILAAVDGLVVSAGRESLPEPKDRPIAPAPDFILLLDDLGWFYWYCHLSAIEVKPGQKVKKGERIGLIGKEGGSGGCSHLHFEIKGRQPSGLWGTEDGYAYIWEAYAREQAPPLLAVARPHRLTFTGDPLRLDGRRSRSFAGEIVRYDWTFTDGSTASSPAVERTYAAPGTYSEVLKVTDSKGHVDYDFAVVQVFDREAGSARDKFPPTINVNYFPTFGIRPGDEVGFAVRTFATRAGKETWDFGDGTPPVTTQSDGNADPHAKDGYAPTAHRYGKAGHYLVRVERTGQNGAKAVGRVHVRVGETVTENLTVLQPEDQPRKMLYRHLEAECGKLLEARRKTVAALKTPEDVRRRQEDLRAKFLAALGPFPEKTPLNAKVTNTLRRDGYRVENLVYESRPDHHVPANLYVPEGPGPFPGVLFPLGHYGNPRPAEEYQRACILLAKHGFVVLTYDPPGQGERHQLVPPGRGPAAQGTTEHTLIDCGALLVGSCAANYFIWDGIRGLDYMAGRPEVDPKRLGCMGNSGGGTMTAYLMAVDERVACAVPNCYITSLEKLIATVGPQDGEANIPGQIAFGMGHPDYFLLRAPRPAQLSCPTRDYYDIEGAWATFREAKVVYGILGHAERMDLFEWDAPHSISKPGRQAALRWMRRWLQGADDAPVETDFPVAKDDELRVTKSGHVIQEFKGRTLYDVTADRAKELEAKRPKLAKDDLLKEVRRLIAVDTVAPAAEIQSPRTSVEREGYRILLRLFETERGIRVPALSFIPPDRKELPKLLYVHGEGKAKDAGPGGPIERWVREGYAVTAIDLRGMGETEPEAPHRGLERNFRADWKEAYLGFDLDRPLLGMRVRDLLAVLHALDPEGRGVRVVGVGSAAPVALHAAALDPRIRELALEGMVISWYAVARTPLTMNQLTNVVHGALKVYDLPDLAASIAPRPLTVRGALDAAGKPVPQAALEEAYAAARTAYAGASLVLEAEARK